MTKKRRKPQRKRNNTAKLQMLSALAYIIRRHRRHVRILGIILLVMTVGVGVWLGQEYWRMGQLREAQARVDSKYDGIKIESASYNSDTIRGYMAYAVTENKTINDVLRTEALEYFQPCKDNALKDKSVISECQVTFTIDFATADYLQITTALETFRNKSLLDAKRQGFLFNRHSGVQLLVENLFKPDADYLEILAETTRKQLIGSFKESYEHNSVLKSEIERLTTPSKKSFNNFVLTEGEKISFAFNDLASYTKDHSVVTVTVDSGTLYDLFNDRTLGTFFPKLKEQKEAERKLAEEAKRKAEEAAGQDAAARNHTRQQVAANRSNINCAVMKCIALTFDDGPSAYTDQVLDALAARNAVATFFVLGNKVASGSGILQRAVSTHNEIANHSWSHPDLTRLSSADITMQVEQTNQAIFSATGSYPKLMRPPYAALDNRVGAQIGMPIALWSIDPQDWLYRDSSTVYSNVIARASPGAVVILHDIHPTTVYAVPSIIDELQRQGYVLVTMSELIGIDQNNLSSYIGHTIRRR